MAKNIFMQRWHRNLVPKFPCHNSALTLVGIVTKELLKFFLELLIGCLLKIEIFQISLTKNYELSLKYKRRGTFLFKESKEHSPGFLNSYMQMRAVNQKIKISPCVRNPVTQVVALCLCPLAWALKRTLRIPYYGHHMSEHWPIRTKTLAKVYIIQTTLMTPAN